MVTKDSDGNRLVVSTTYRNVKIDVVDGNITKILASCLVNPTNKELLGPLGNITGIDYIIHQAAGLNLLLDLMSKYRSGDGVTGGAYPTASHGMAPRVRRIIHAVGPDYRELRNNPIKAQKTRAVEDLQSVYRNSFDVAYGDECYVPAMTIAFPSISTGNFKFPRPLAAKIALTAIRAFVDKQGDFIESGLSNRELPKRIMIILKGPSDPNETPYKNEFPRVFGVNKKIYRSYEESNSGDDLDDDDDDEAPARKIRKISKTIAPKAPTQKAPTPKAPAKATAKTPGKIPKMTAAEKKTASPRRSTRLLTKNVAQALSTRNTISTKAPTSEPVASKKIKVT